MPTLLLRLTPLLLLVAMVSGCATQARRAERPPLEPRSVPTFRGDSGAMAGWEEIVSAARGADVVIIGENHGHPTGLPWAAALWKDVLAESPDAALALEFFERDEQSRLDEYLAGVVDEATFRRRTQRSGGNYPAGHRDMVEAARAAGRPVIAANAPRPLVRLARLEGYDRLRALAPSLARLFRIPETDPPQRYRDDFFGLMIREPADHSAAAAEAPAGALPTEEQTTRAESMLRSQSLWDWTMAESVAGALAAGNRPVVLVVGRFHSDFDGGLVHALRHLKPDAGIVTFSTVPADAVSLAEADRGRAAFVAYIGPGPGED